MSLPWSSAAGQATATPPSLLAVAVTLAGGSGRSAVGRTVFDVAFGPGPFALIACTVNEYSVPLSRPSICVERVRPLTRLDLPPPSTTYVLIGAPFDAAGAHTIRADLLPAVAVTEPGAPGGDCFVGCFGPFCVSVGRV